MNQSFPDIDTYIGSFPENIQELLVQMRETISKAAPEATESMSYGMPAFKIHGKPLVYFAAFSKHIGFYATPSGHSAFSAELSGYKQGKGSVQFPFGSPLPLDLVKRIVEFRVYENSEKKRGNTNKP